MAIPTQNWFPILDIEYTLNAGVLNPNPPQEIEILIKNVIDEDPLFVSPYSEYRLYLSSLPAPWLNDDSYIEQIPAVSENAFVPYTNGMSFTFTPQFQGLLQLTNGIHDTVFAFFIYGRDSNQNLQLIDSLNVQLKMTVSNQIPFVPVTFSPESLAFTHGQGEILPSYSVTIDGSLWEIVGKPNFVLSSATVGVTVTTVNNAGVIHQIVSGSGEATVDIALGEYYDTNDTFTTEDLASVFVIKSDGVAVDTLPFTVVVTLFVVSPYDDNNKAFTLDPAFFTFATDNVGTYFQVDALIKTYQFFTNTLKEYTVPQKIVFFNSQETKINLGQIIHRLMHNFTEVNENLLQYKPAILSLSCSEILVLDQSVVRTKTLADISFVAGLSRGMTNVGFLDFNPKPNRVTRNSIAYLNILVPNGDYQLEVKKNGVAAFELPIENPNNTIVLIPFNFLDYTQGDFISIYINQPGEAIDENTPKKEFYVFPEGNYSNTLVWENEFLLQSVLECTDSASISTDFEFISQKTVENLVEIINYLDSKKEVKLVINTGWLAETDVDTIESLLRSKRAWLLNPQGNISLRPIPKKMINRDFKRELIEYTLEFIINRQYDEETYSL